MPRKSKNKRKQDDQLRAARRSKERKRMEDEAARQRKRRFEEALARWEDKIDVLEEAIRPFEHQKGKARTMEQNVMVIQSCIGLMRDASALAEESEDISLLSTTNVDHAASRIHKFSKQHITSIRSTLEKEDELIIAFGDPSKRGCGSPNYDMSIHRVLDDEQVKFLYNYIDEQHKEGRTVTNQKLRHAIRCKYGIDMRRSTLQGYLRRMGLTWRPATAKKKTFKAYRKDAVGHFLIEYNKALNDPDVIPVFIDESYVHPGHCVTHSHIGDGMALAKVPKGRRLIILNAITRDGPLTDCVDGLPVDNLTWNGDTPHPDGELPNGLTTAECLWLAQSSTGDYHDNMNGIMFNKWMQEKCWPAFAKKYPGKKMCPVMDNAAYHHVRKIGSLNGITKKKLIQHCLDYGVTYLELPLTPERVWALDGDDSNEYHYVQDRGEYCSVDIDGDGTLWDTLSQSAAVSRPFVPTKSELQVAFVNWLRENNPSVLECEVEAFIKKKGGYCIWTAPYAAKSQPVEIFWAAGKNYTAEHCFNGRTMKQTVQVLREGWHGNKHLWPDPNDDSPGYIGTGNMQRRKVTAANCGGMVDKAEMFMNKLFIPIAGFSGDIYNLQVPHNWKATTEEMPMDMILSLDLELEKSGSKADVPEGVVGPPTS